MANNSKKDLDLIIDIDDHEMNDEEKSMFEAPSSRDKQLCRWFLTANNPFWSDEEKNREVDISTTDLEVKFDYYNLDYLKTFNNIDLFEFHFIKVSAKVKEKQIEKCYKEIKDEKGETKLEEVDLEKEVLVDKEFVVERPYFKSYDHFKNYIENLMSDGLVWSCGQVERGLVNNTLHIQFGCVFDRKSAKRFYTMKKYFPTCYIAQARGTNYDIKVYCTKQATRVEEPYEIGEFIEKGSRGDLDEFYSAIKSGADNLALQENFFSLTSRFGFEKIERMRDTYFNSKYRSEGRNVEVTYIYGDAGVGKTSYVLNKFGFNNVFSVSYYGKFMFNGYSGEKVLLLDEFNGSLDLTWLNKILDCYPLKLEIKGGERLACYDKVFIVSNHSYLDFYKNSDGDSKMFNTFYRRLHFIYRVEHGKGFIVEKESEFEDIPEDERKFPGITRRVSKSWKYDNYDYKTCVYDAHENNEPKLELAEQQELIF